MIKGFPSCIQTIPFARGVRVLKSLPNGGLFAVDKPAGVLSHPNPPLSARLSPSDPSALRRQSSIIDSPYNFDDESYYVQEAGSSSPRRVHLIHRLDSPTSGILLLSLDASLAAAIKELFKKSQVLKQYVAIVKGRNLDPPSGLWRSSLQKLRHEGGGVRSIPLPFSRSAVTSFRVERSAADKLVPLSLMYLQPSTGRTHQLRVQAAEHGFPILGDRTYGDFDFNKRFAPKRGAGRLFLHAQSIKLKLPGTNDYFHVKTTLPGAFTEVLGETNPGRSADPSTSLQSSK